MIWNLQGDAQQNALVQQAIDACDFPFEEMAPSLAREGKTSISVFWDDLSRYNHGAKNHEHAEGAHAIVREVEGRKRVLGLFYLPPYTKVVLDSSLINHPTLAQEVFLAEGAHAVDYHWMLERGLRRVVWNAVHSDDQDTTGDIPESGDLDHGHSWFDGPAGYGTWVGETWMALFIEAFAPSIPVTINLQHPITWNSVQEVRSAFFPEPEPEPPTDPVYRGKTKTYHDSHRRIEPVEWFDSPTDAEAEGLRPCGVCKPNH